MAAVTVPATPAHAPAPAPTPTTMLDAPTFLTKLETLKSEKESLEQLLKQTEDKLGAIVNKSKKGLFEQAPSLQDHDTKLITKELLGNFAKDDRINEFINKNSKLLYLYRRACDFFSMQIAKCADLGEEFITLYIPNYIYTPETVDKIDNIKTTPVEHDKNDFIRSCYRKPNIFLQRKAKIEEFAKSGEFKMISMYNQIFATLVHACIKDVWIKSEHMQAIRSYIKKERVLFGDNDIQKITAAIIYTDIICGIHTIKPDVTINAKKEFALKINTKTDKITKDISAGTLTDIIIDIIKPPVLNKKIDDILVSASPFKQPDEATLDMIDIFISLKKQDINDNTINVKYKIINDNANYYKSRSDGDCGFSAIAQIYEGKDDSGKDADITNKIQQLRALLKKAYTLMGTKSGVKAQLNPLYDEHIITINNSNREDMTFDKYADFISHNGNWAIDEDFIIIMKLLGDLPFMLISEQNSDVVVSYNNINVRNMSIPPYYIFYNVNLMHWQLRKPDIKARNWGEDLAYANAVLKAIE
jgi:hypothetical protein